MSQYQVLARKYRPQTFKEVIGQEPIVKTLKNALKSGKLAHAYLFCGSRGTGKTTLARILAKALNCQNLSDDFEPCNQCRSCQEITTGCSLDVLEIDGASHRGIDDIKQINDSVGYCPANGKSKVYIIDEVHMLTKEAFNALLKTLEEPPANVKFFFATTEANKIPATIISRCQRFNLQRIPQPQIVAKLQEIANDLKVNVETPALQRIASFSEGGLRDAESLFDQMIAFSQGNVTQEIVQDVLGVMPQELFFELDAAVQAGDVKVAYQIAHTLFMQGKELSHFLEDLNAHYKAILLTKLACTELLLDCDPSLRQSLKNSSEIYTQEQCLLILDYIQESVQALKNAISPQMSIEALLAKIVRIRLKVPVELIAKRLIALETRLSTNLPAEVTTVTQTDVSPAMPKSCDASLESRSQPIAAEVAKISKPKPEAATFAVKASPVNRVLTASRTEAPRPPAVEPSPVKATPPKPKPAVVAPSQISLPAPMIADEVQKNARYDTLVQFAAVELDGTVQRKRRK